MTDDRLVDIESRLAHQDQQLLDLDDVVTAQQARIMQLEQLCESLLDRVRAIGEALPGEPPGDERPPHY